MNSKSISRCAPQAYAHSEILFEANAGFKYFLEGKQTVHFKAVANSDLQPVCEYSLARQTLLDLKDQKLKQYTSIQTKLSS